MHTGTLAYRDVQLVVHSVVQQPIRSGLWAHVEEKLDLRGTS